MKENYKELCINLAKRRVSLGMSQKEVATKANYRQTNSISILERGGGTIPLRKLADIAKAYKVDQNLLYLSVLRLKDAKEFELQLDLLTFLRQDMSKKDIIESIDKFIKSIHNLSATQTK
jgi:transcriptional regulator with XRE-family HTH domain